MPPRSLDAVPRAGIGHWPTPLERCDRVREALGDGCPELWVKREDCSGLALGGNKVRKLDVLLGDALRQGAGRVLTYGALQSNHARQTAAACARLGLGCELVLTRLVDRGDGLYDRNGNRLLDDLLGATVTVLDDPSEVAGAVEAARERAAAAGEVLTEIPPGGTSPLGALGYVAAVEEWTAQSRAAGVRFDHVVVASSTGGTQAGILTGLKRTGAPATQVHGVAVYADAGTTAAAVAALLPPAAAELGMAPVPAEAVHVADEWLGGGYGVPTPAMREAVALFARTEGLLLDPVYSGKAGAALVGMIRSGSFAAGAKVLFVHTGGVPALFAYGDEVLA